MTLHPPGPTLSLRGWCIWPYREAPSNDAFSPNGNDRTVYKEASTVGRIRDASRAFACFETLLTTPDEARFEYKTVSASVGTD